MMILSPKISRVDDEDVSSSGLTKDSQELCVTDCGEELVWKYIKAYEETQKYKEGKCVLDKFKIIKSNG
ncbi:hypothetical protein GLYMA_16G022500v4 [Glycine max]|uniref:Yippee domain-containing protein n=2 Tax=Glycine subgen. Soja TaxID=1462606 RepID=K7MES7_SOYBN|nr:hypothetical protein GYH30_043901 [Glycine max]KRH06433.1 hypothetical protein GLYMA_16G022500v4 [Glycine max]RZB59207.1 hypothetical protein D0Y65_042471 [Glycine soja]